ncbi:MAG: sugar phosphate isomerase/epimerase family protein [Candidatus Thorarchaeota archaeon]
MDQIRTLVRVRDAGYENVELWMDDRPSWVTRTIEQALDDFSLNPYSIHLPKFLIAFDDDDFNRVIQAVFPFVERLGIKVAVFHPPDKKLMQEIDWQARFSTLLDLSEESGCSLTIENVPYLNDVDRFIKKQIESNKDRPLGVTIDLEFMHINGSEIQQMIHDFNTRILNVHFRDSDGSLLDESGRRKYLQPGTGVIDLQAVLGSLLRGGYDKALTVEVSYRRRENIAEARTFLTSCLESVLSPSD